MSRRDFRAPPGAPGGGSPRLPRGPGSPWAGGRAAGAGPPPGAPRITVDGEPAGERGLSPGAAQEIDISLHGPVRESATTARSGGRDGDAVALTPGTSDASTRLPGPRSAPTAALLTVNGKAWRW